MVIIYLIREQYGDDVASNIFGYEYYVLNNFWHHYKSLIYGF